MLTLTAQLPTTFPATSTRSTPPVGSSERRHHPTTMPRRPRRDVLHMLAGADGARLPHLPRRRLVR